MIARLVVLDTNVLVSALLNKTGIPATIVDWAVDAEAVIPVVSEKILAEYDDVLRRPKFRYPKEDVDSLLADLRSCAIFPDITPAHICTLVDQSDECFAECALAARAELVTGNTADYLTLMDRIRILTPRQFYDSLRT